MGRMPVSLAGQLVVAFSSRALFDFEEENQVFEASDDRAYMQLQLQRLERAAKPGVAFSLVNKLLAFNTPGKQRVGVSSLWQWDLSGLGVDYFSVSVSAAEVNLSFDSATLDVQLVPEPSVLPLALLGAGLLVLRRRNQT